MGKKISTVAGAGFQMVAPRGMDALQWPVKMLIGRMLNAGDAAFELAVALALIPSASIETLIRPMLSATNARNITTKVSNVFILSGPICTNPQLNSSSKLARPLLPVNSIKSNRINEQISEANTSQTTTFSLSPIQTVNHLQTTVESILSCKAVSDKNVIQLNSIQLTKSVLE